MAERSINPKDLASRGKNQLSLLPAAGIWYGALAMSYGAYEAPRVDGTFGYGPYNWREADISYMTYLSALKRHIDALLQRQDYDATSRVHHLGHLIANGAILADSLEGGFLIDDRPFNTTAEWPPRFGRIAQLQPPVVEMTHQGDPGDEHDPSAPKGAKRI